jgi:hypothetical protein
MRWTATDPGSVQARDKGCVWCGDAECEQVCPRCGRCCECAGRIIDGECEHCCEAD